MPKNGFLKPLGSRKRGSGGGGSKIFWGQQHNHKKKMCGNFGGFLLETLGDKKFLYFDDAQYDMENSVFALAPKCSRNVDEDHLIFKSYYIYDILAPKFDPQGGCILTPLGTPSNDICI